MDEVAADHEELVETLREAVRPAIDALNQLLERGEQAEAIGYDTPGLSSQRISTAGFDARLRDWKRNLEEMLEADSSSAGFSDFARARLEDFRG